MKVLKLQDSDVEGAAAKAAAVLSEGGIVLYPTDTVYGLGVDITNADALARLYALKGRSPHSTPLVVMRDVEEIARFGEMSDVAYGLAAGFLPGALTLVLTAREEVPTGIIRDDGTIGVRIPDDAFCLALSRAFGKPYTTTSANRTSMTPEASIEAILAQFGELAQEIALVIDDGPREGGLSSTIVSCVGDVPEILREGRVTREELGL